jgi:predicted RNA binding protein YcfA (HicA-like mRNA interferase family)
MSQIEKLISKILSLSKDMRFDELRKILEGYGYKMRSPRGGSSHATFRKKGCNPITIPRHEPISRTYVEMVKNVVEEEMKNEENRGLH